MLAGTLNGVEMGLAGAGVPFTRGELMAAVDVLSNREITEHREASSVIGPYDPIPFDAAGSDQVDREAELAQFSHLRPRP